LLIEKLLILEPGNLTKTFVKYKLNILNKSNIYYKILPQLNKAYQDQTRINIGKKVKEGFVYRSDKNI
jgi:hypothetical protein